MLILRFGTLVRILYQEMNMSNKDDGLSQLVQDVIDGKAEKKELCNKIYKEVYALAYPVYQNEEKSMTQRQ